MADRLQYARGALAPADAAAEANEADLLATGEGFFETLLVGEGVIRNVDAHADRFLATAARLELDVTESRAQLLAAAVTVASSARAPWSRLRITAFVGNGAAEVMVSTAPYVPPSLTANVHGVSVRLARSAGIRRDDSSRQVKSLAWRREGESLLRDSSGAYDVLLLNDEGRLAEGARTNVVVRCGSAAVTPPLDEGCLPGTVRERLLRSGVVREGVVDLPRILSGGEVALTNSLIGVLPVSHVDDSSCEVLGLADELRAVLEAPQ